MKRNMLFAKIGLLTLGASLFMGALAPAHAQWQAWSWGYNTDGELGIGTNAAVNVPTRIPSFTGVSAMSGYAAHTLAIRRDGTVWAWGYGAHGQLGNGATSDSNAPVPVTGLTGITAIAAGADYSLAVKSNGTVWAWGDGSVGQLGNGQIGSGYQVTTPVQVENLTNAVSVAAGEGESLALLSDGTVWEWGAVYVSDMITYDTTPVKVSNLTNVTAIASNFWVYLALKSDGTVWAWGANSAGPTQLSNLTGITAIAADGANACALKSDGTVWTCSVTVGYTNTQISSLLNNITAVACGPNHGLALKQDGTVWAWGANTNGELGDGIYNGTSGPLQVAGLTGITGIAAGGDCSFAIKRVGLFDLTGDGQNDLLWRNTVDGTLNYYLMSDGQFISYGTITSTVPNTWQVVAQPDINGDGTPDIIWQNQSTGDVTYWIMNGTQFSGTWGYIVQGIDPVWQVVAAADIDGDGNPDLVYQNSQTGDVTYLQIVNKKYTGKWGYLSQGMHPVWHVVAAVDLFGDGNNDLVWWNSVTGDVVYFRMNKTKATGAYGYLAQGIPTDWHVVGMADFTGDGWPDIVWQNTQTSDVTYYEVTRNALGNPQWDGKWAYLSQGVPTLWQLTGLR